jgi:outer membrane immunogenic protein
MKPTKRTIAIGLLLSVLASEAGAQSRQTAKRPPPAPPPQAASPAAFQNYAPAYNWSGLYYGGTVGVALANTDHYYDRQNGKNDHGQVWLDSSGFAISGHVGYNVMMPSLWVFGVEAEIGYLGINQERIVIKDDDVLRLKTGLFGTIRGRVGYAFGRFLPYVTAGFGFVDVENAGGNPANANRYLTISEWRPGLVVGAGAEYAFSQNLIARLEYLYFDTKSYEVRNLENEMMKFDNNIHLVRAGLSYKF